MKVCGLPFSVLKPLMIQLDMIPQYVPFFSYLFIFGAEQKVEEVEYSALLDKRFFVE